MAVLLGYRAPDELARVDFATTVFESADDLRWLVEHRSSDDPAEAVETAWKRKDGTRLIVRLFARAAGSNGIDILVQDITSLRLVEERLQRARRMEAVGRVASEVAVTCDNLLRGVSQEGQQWLAALATDAALRAQGQQLLGEVTRAASLLRQLSVYGDKQTSALEPVDAASVLRDLEPVLKQVAGNGIELVLPKKTSSPIHVDIDNDRLERVLVNVACYGRERMPFGGRLMIDLAKVVVGREFIAKYPNVRQGAHVLITVSEMRGKGRQDRVLGFRQDATDRHTSSPALESPGLDLGALQEVIADCGGHLWMEVAPSGDMVLKIHLPLRAIDAPRRSSKPARPGRLRSMGRWFHS
jgi:hypothetical protein